MRRTRRLRPALGITVSLALLAGVAGAANPAFVQAPGSPLAAQGPHSEAAADLNGDGKLDLAVANFDSDSVAIFPGDGTGGFGAPSAVAVGDGPLGLALGDLDGDGDLDLAVANTSSDSLSIHLGDGQGGFAAAGPPIALTDGPWYVSIGDLNRDRRPDVVVAHVGFGGPFVPSQHVSILLGDGAGGFSHAPGSPLTVGKVPYGVEIADFNGDHDPDLAIANQFDNFVSILLGDGTGQFAPAPISPIVVGSGPSWLVAEDFNGDRNVDIAVAVSGSSGTIAVLLGDGAAGFTHAPGSPIAISNPHNMRAADFDRDGELDLGVDRLSSKSFSVLLGDGAGGFQTASTTPVGTGPLSMAVGDFNADRKPDVAVGNHFDDNVSVLLNATVTPAESIHALRQEVESSGLAKGLRNSLAAKLRVAERNAGDNNNPACGALGAFVAEARARIGSGGLTEALALAWIADADAIRDDLGCVN